MRQLSRWVFRTVIVAGILGLVLAILFFIVASGDATRMTTTEYVIGIPMVLSWIYFWVALVVGIILRLLSMERSG